MRDFSLNHYERAFENWLIDHQIPYVHSEEHHRLGPSDGSVKNFDFLLRPESGRKIIVEVKGRTFCRHDSGGSVRPGVLGHPRRREEPPDVEAGPWVRSRGGLRLCVSRGAGGRGFRWARAADVRLGPVRVLLPSAGRLCPTHEEPQPQMANGDSGRGGLPSACQDARGLPVGTGREMTFRTSGFL